MRVLVLPIDHLVTHGDLPGWMHDFWVGKAGYGPREIARYIRRALITGPLSELPGILPYGRGALVDRAISAVNDVVLRTEQTPNVMVVAGNAGIGRRTFARKFLVEAFPSTPELNYGPEFQLPQFADLADIYRALRQEMETTLSVKRLPDDLKAFGEAPVVAQAVEVARKLSHFGDLGQAVTVVSGNGIFVDKGYLKQWVPELFRQLEGDRRTKLILVSNRLLHENELRAHPNVLQLQIPPITDEFIRTLMIGSATMLEVKPELPNVDVIRSIGGHPGIARATAALIARKGPAIINSDPRDLFSLQEDVLSESLNFHSLAEIEKDILSLLSWVPQLAGDMLRKIILERHQIGPEKFAETVSGLILACLVEVSGANYLISGPVRALFRRLHGYGSKELMRSFSPSPKDEWNRAHETDELRAELLDAIAYMAAIEGGTLPPEFKALLLPSTIQGVVRDTYDRGHDDVASLKRVMTWGLPAKKMNMDETTREEILSYVIRAQTRLGDAAGAEEVLAFFDDRAYRSRYYLRSFYVRFHKRDLRSAIPLLRKAREMRKYIGQVVGDLALCYQRLGMWQELRQLVRDEEQHIGRNPVLLNVRIGMLIAQNEFNSAERAIRTLRSLPREEATADSRTAMIMMRRDQDYVGAQTMLTSILERSSGVQAPIRHLRAIAAASSGDLRVARADADFLRSSIRNYSTDDIEARIKLSDRDYEGAERELDKASHPGVREELLRARILDAKAGGTRLLRSSTASACGKGRQRSELRIGC